MTTLDDLVLIPTNAERQLCKEAIASVFFNMSVSVHLCGWGVIEAAVGATRLIKDLRPRRVWLVGIAGAISSVNPLVPNLTAETTTGAGLDLELGQAYEFTRITIDGIGVGQGSSHLSFDQLGWQKLFGGPIGLSGVVELNPFTKKHLDLLTVCSASASLREAEVRRRRHPSALAEDMESFSVAAACNQLGVPLRVIRGISNWAGDREQARWQTKRAMLAAIETVSQRISEN